MFEPLDMSRFEALLATPRGWAELLAVVACIGLAWYFSRVLARRARAGDAASHGRLQAGLARIVFPLTALVLLVVARFAFRHYGSRASIIEIAMPFLLALAAIRLVVYAMRTLFASQDWLKAGERAIAFSIWGVLILHFTGVLNDFKDELDAIRLPIGRSEISLLS